MAHKTISAALAAAILAGLPAVSLAQVASPLTGETAQAVSDAATEAASNAEAAAQTATEAAQEAATAAGNEAEAAAGAAADAARDAAQAAEAAADAVTATTEEAPATETPATEAPATETPATETPAATAAPETPAEPPVGAYYVRETFTDWTLRCIRTPDGNDPCELYQLMRDGEGNSVAEMTMIPLEGGGQAVTGASVVAPLETDLQFGVGFQIDAGEAKRYPFSFCAPVGCVSRMGFTNAELSAMKRGLVGHVVLLPFGAPEAEAFDLEMSLAGFTAGYAALEEIVAELRAAAEAEAGATQ